MKSSIATAVVIASCGLAVTAAPAVSATVPARHHAACHGMRPHHGRVRVPDVEGMVPPQARIRLRQAGLRPRFVPAARGIVAYQVPAPGRRAACGSSVALHMAATG